MRGKELVKEISDKIKESIAPEMIKWESEMFNYIKQLERYCKYEVYEQAGRKGAIEIFKLKTKAGWTKSMDIFFSRTEVDLRAMLHKEAEAKLSKIDAAVAKKLSGVEVTSVEMINFTTTAKDAYCEGSWLINGTNLFSFRTIYAGGYNIQQLHVRTIYQYK